MRIRPIGLCPAQQRRGPDVGAAEDEGEHAEQGEADRGQAGRKAHRRLERRQQLGQRAGRQQQHRHADDGRQSAPEAGEDSEQRDVTFHKSRVGRVAG
jgi:hypothetical protein